MDEGAVVELVSLSKTGSATAQDLAAAVISDLAKGAIVEREQAMRRKQASAATAQPQAPSPSASTVLERRGEPPVDGEAARFEPKRHPSFRSPNRDRDAERTEIRPEQHKLCETLEASTAAATTLV